MSKPISIVVVVIVVVVFVVVDDDDDLVFSLLFYPTNLPFKVWLKSGQEQLRY